jgi:hypothetical protein
VSRIEECIHLLDPSTCVLCNGREKRERAVVRWTNPFPARYAGLCSVCSDQIEVDEPIVYNGTTVAHDGCEE